MFRWVRLWEGPITGVALAIVLGLAQEASAAEPVDVELALAVDVSLSMSPAELEIQRRGYVAALTDDRVIEAIEQGVHGKIAITYFEWAGSTSQHIIVPWTTIASREDAEHVASQLAANPPKSARRTSIAGALEFGADLFAESGFRSTKRVIDISGDGSNNQGPPVEIVRNAVLAQGITINGLPLMTKNGLTRNWDVPDLDRYYADCVIGGPGAFMIPVNDWSQFPETVRRKLVLELAGPGSRQWAAQEAANPRVFTAQSPVPYDCLIGERLWSDRSWMWDSR
jgi:Protein of unknown function (DUF1194)